MSAAARLNDGEARRIEGVDADLAGELLAELGLKRREDKPGITLMPEQKAHRAGAQAALAVIEHAKLR